MHKKSSPSQEKNRKVQTSQVPQRGSIKIRPLAATNYSLEDSTTNQKQGRQNQQPNRNVIVLPPVSQTSQNYKIKETPVTDNKNSQINKGNQDAGSLGDINSVSNIQSNIVESPNLKKAVSKYSEVPENFDLNNNSILTKQVRFFSCFLKI